MVVVQLRGVSRGCYFPAGDFTKDADIRWCCRQPLIPRRMISVETGIGIVLWSVTDLRRLLCVVLRTTWVLSVLDC
jgi:hypothetical protein